MKEIWIGVGQSFLLVIGVCILVGVVSTMCVFIHRVWVHVSTGHTTIGTKCDTQYQVKMPPGFNGKMTVDTAGKTIYVYRKKEK